MKIFIYFFIPPVDSSIKRFEIDKNIVLMSVKLLVSLNEITLIINDEGNGFENVKAFVDNFLFSVHLISRSQNWEQNVLKNIIHFPRGFLSRCKKKKAGRYITQRSQSGKLLTTCNIQIGKKILQISRDKLNLHGLKRPLSHIPIQIWRSIGKKSSFFPS